MSEASLIGADVPVYTFFTDPEEGSSGAEDFDELG